MLGDGPAAQLAISPMTTTTSSLRIAFLRSADSPPRTSRETAPSSPEGPLVVVGAGTDTMSVQVRMRQPRPLWDGLDMAPGLLIVDDHAGFRALARDLLEGEGVEVVGEAADGVSAIVAARALHPAVVLLDVHLPGDDGFAVAEQLALLPDPPVVVLISSRPGSDIRRRMASSKAAGFIHKGDLSAAAIANITG